jgi:TetR/AcrR family transcriptional regulator, cholesterol catabolism regulator
MDISETISNKAQELFMNYGIVSITIDDIAFQLGMSKKTIHKYYKDKDALVDSVIDMETTNHEAQFSKPLNDSQDAIEALYKNLEKIDMLLRRLNPAILFCLRLHHPSSYDKLTWYLNYVLHGIIKKNIQQGIVEGLYRSDFDIDIIITFLITNLLTIFNTNTFPAGKYKLRNVEINYFTHFLYGITTNKGHTIVKCYAKNFRS